MDIELGLIEGFYGRPWSWAERANAVTVLAPHGYRFFHYAPKNDEFLRKRWREPHPEPELAALANLGATCRRHGVRLGLGLSPYELYRDFSAPARKMLAAKLENLDETGAEDLAILFDDMRGDRADLARRQAEIVDFIASRTCASRLIVCPTYYTDDPSLDRFFGPRPPGYLRELGSLLDKAIAIQWTGPKVCSREFSREHLERVAEEIGRKPFLWDNYPVNDGARMSMFLHLRAFTGRPSTIAQHISAHGVNPASQSVLSLIPAITLSLSYLDGPAYDHWAAFRKAAQAMLGEALAEAVERDLAAFQDQGLDKLGTERTALRKRYAGFDHPAAREIVAWLDGAYAVEPHTVPTQ
jgi:hypothetical protein